MNDETHHWTDGDSLIPQARTARQAEQTRQGVKDALKSTLRLLRAPFTVLCATGCMAFCAILAIGFFNPKKVETPPPVVKDQSHAPTMPTFHQQLCAHAVAWSRARQEDLPPEIVKACQPRASLEMELD